MHLTQSEKILLVRWRLQLTQHQFYGSICSIKEAIYIENKEKYKNQAYRHKSKTQRYIENKYSKSYNDTIEKLSAIYDLNPKDLTIGEKARIMRERAGDSITAASKKLDRCVVWITNAERGVFYKHKRTSQNNAQELYEFYTSEARVRQEEASSLPDQSS